MNDDGAADDVREELAAASELGITGVPAFVFDQKYLVPGAVDTATFLRILDEIQGKAAKSQRFFQDSPSTITQ